MKDRAEQRESSILGFLLPPKPINLWDLEIPSLEVLGRNNLRISTAPGHGPVNEEATH